MLSNWAADPRCLQINPASWEHGSSDPERLLQYEWLVTNGIGGYGSGTVSGVSTRRYHGLLTAALPAPFGRMVMLNHVVEELVAENGDRVSLSAEETPAGLTAAKLCSHLESFRLENGLPIWQFRWNESLLEKRLWFVHQSNTLHVRYRRLEGLTKVLLRVRPSMNFRRHETAVSHPLSEPYRLTIDGNRVEVASSEVLPLRIRVEGHNAVLLLDGGAFREQFHRIEANRGYDAVGVVWSPGFYQMELTTDGSTDLVASTDDWEAALAISADDSLRAELQRRERLMSDINSSSVPTSQCETIVMHLALAADQFVIAPTTRTTDVALAHAAGNEARTIIAGYHWFTDWGRDTMISLEGLTLVTGRPDEARSILQTFARHVRDGLIPNLFPEGERDGLYHTADATLWFFHALSRYVHWTDDRQTLRAMLPVLLEIVRCHRAGTKFGIRVDPADGLLRQGAAGYQLTWMDAKVGDWVVTPRRGKAVEINALWYNALRLLQTWSAEEGDAATAEELRTYGNRVYESFNRRFWFADGGYLYDVVDGEGAAADSLDAQSNDTSFRPNQLFAISLSHAVLAPDYWQAVLQKCVDRLMTPFGLRTLAPGHQNYMPNYEGDLRSRDAAYHQGTVWAWLIGPAVDAWLRVYPDDLVNARSFLEGFCNHLAEACIGSINEIFDAEAPYTPRGCVAQAWSVAEVLRCWVKTGGCQSGKGRVGVRSE